MATPVTALSVHVRPRSTRCSGSASLLAASTLLGSCYSGDFFDRLVDPTATAAFRITNLTLIDPHTYIGNPVQCEDSTASLNKIFADSIASFDVNTTLVLHPLDPKVASDAKMEILPAKCVPGEDLVNCTDKDVPLLEIVSADFNNSIGGTCGNPVAMSLNPAYQGGGNTPLNQAMSPCFLSAPIPKLGLKLALDVTLQLSNAQIYSTYALDGRPQQLVSGVIFGFVPASVAMMPIGELGGGPFALWSNLAGGGACNPPGIDDIDTLAPENGVWMYFNFTAERVAWSPESDLPGTTGDPTGTDSTTTDSSTDSTATGITTSGTTTTATDFTTSTATLTAGT